MGKEDEERRAQEEEQRRSLEGCNPVKKAGPVSLEHVLLALRETEEERELRIRSLFSFFDVAGLGYLDFAQIEAGLLALRIPAEYKYARDLLKVCDSNKDGRVDIDEFRKLWVYLHRDREEEDFEDDGTSSTKKWKRPRKDGTDADAGAVVGGSCLDPDPTSDTGARIGTDTGAGVAVGGGGSAAAAAAAGTSTSRNTPVEKVEKVEKKVENVCENVSPASKSIVGGLTSTTGLTAGASFGLGTGFATSTILGSGAKMLCRENSTNDDFDDEDAGKERLFGAILM